MIEAKHWYKNQKPGLDRDFEQEVKRCTNRLHKNPFGYQIKYDKVRTAFTDIFPYAVHFFIDEPKGIIVIIAKVHQTRNPILGLERSKNL